MVTRAKQTERYLKWSYLDETNQQAGYIVVERYHKPWMRKLGCEWLKPVPGEKQASHLHWHVELIHVTPERQGISTLLLNTARSHLADQPLSFHAITAAGAA